MTKKQMISTLRGMNFGTVIGSKGDEALRMAIAELEQEPYDRFEYGTDGNVYKMTISNGKEFEQEPCLSSQEKSRFSQEVSQEPCDTISRDAVLDLLDKDRHEYTIQKVKALPSVQSKPIDCDDAISRAELYKAIDSWDKFGYTETGCFVRLTKEFDEKYVGYVHLEDVITAIQGMPSVQPSRKGHWIDYSDEGYVECPFCEHATNCEGNIAELHYCFWCGASMEGSKE